MFFQIELLYFVVMIATFCVLVLLAKLPTGVSLMASAVVGAILSAIFSKTSFEARYFVEGVFGYYDTILVITTATIFMGAMKECGALDYISAVLVKGLRKYPSLLLLALMFIVMFPSMVTGSAIASAITSGALVAPILVKWGIPKKKAGALVAIGSILGEMAPPINIPAMVIASGVDMPYTGFTLPLLAVTLPLAIAFPLMLCRKYVKPIESEQVETIVNTSVLSEFNWTASLPLIMLILMIVGELIFPRIFGNIGMSLMFVISTVVCFIVGRKMPLYKKGNLSAPLEEKPDSIVRVLIKSVNDAIPAMGLLMGVSMFLEIIAVNGVRGWLVVNAMTLPGFAQFIGSALILPIVGGISSFSSASMLGAPFVMAMYSARDSLALICGFSLFTGIGEFLPPAAISSSFSAEIVGEDRWSNVSKAAIPALATMFVYSCVFTFLYSKIIFNDTTSKTHTPLYLLWMGVMVVVAVGFAVVYNIIVKRGQATLQEVKEVE